MPQTFTLKNGIPVSVWTEPALPLIAVQVQAATGSVLTEPAKAGLPALTAAMLREGAGDRDAAEFADATQRLGAWFWTGADHENATASLTVLKRHLAPAVALLADALRRPRLAESDWQRVRSLQLDHLRALDDDPNAIANRVAFRLLFGDDDPYGWPSEGTRDTVAALTIDDVRREHASLFAPENLTVFVAGDVTAAELQVALERELGNWTPGGAKAPATTAAVDAARAGGGLRVAVVDRQGAVQTVIRFLMPGPRWSDPRRVEYEMLGSVLGGTFDSRLNHKLREEHGYSYGAGATWSMSPFAGYFMAWASVQTDATGAALKDFLAEFARLRAPGGGDVTPEEADAARAMRRTSIIRSFTTLSGVLDYARGLALNGVSFDAVVGDLRALRAATAKDLDALSPRALPLEDGVLVLVGDASAIAWQVREAGLPEPIRLDASGRPTDH